MKYDVNNRLTSVRRRFDHPVFNGGSLVTGAHESRWRGFGYNARGQLTGQWHIDHMSDSTYNTLSNHTVGVSELEQVGYPNGTGHKLNFAREQGVGDLLSITRADDPSIKLWQHKDVNGNTANYKGGHKLDHVEIDEQGPQPVTYDGRGRMTKDTRFEYAYDPTDRLIAARPIGQSTWSELYIYDGLHRLVEEQSGVHVRKMVYDGAQMIAMYEDSQLQWEAIWGAKLDQIVRWHHIPSDTSYIPLQDHRNNIVSLFNASTGRVVQMMDYDANGRMTVLTQGEQVSCVEQGTGQVCGLTDAFPFGFNGAWRSSVTGLSNMRMRWYAPHLGAFTSQDPLEYVDSFNTYAFAAFDPINGWDPFGLSNQSYAQPSNPNKEIAHDDAKNSRSKPKIDDKIIDYLKDSCIERFKRPDVEIKENNCPKFLNFLCGGTYLTVLDLPDMEPIPTSIKLEKSVVKDIENYKPKSLGRDADLLIFAIGTYVEESWHYFFETVYTERQRDLFAATYEGQILGPKLNRREVESAERLVNEAGAEYAGSLMRTVLTIKLGLRRAASEKDFVVAARHLALVRRSIGGLHSTPYLAGFGYDEVGGFLGIGKIQLHTNSYLGSMIRVAVEYHFFGGEIHPGLNLNSSIFKEEVRQVKQVHPNLIVEF